MDVDDYSLEAEQFELVQCNICSRKFRTDVIDKHETICKKASKRKPKVFDSGKMRARGTGIPLNKTIRPGEVVPREPNKDERIIRAEKKRDNWRARHNEFINTIRSAKAYQSAVSKGGSAPPLPPPSSINDPDLIQCSYCNRRFNENAAERHIPFCKEKSERDKLKQSANRAVKRPGHISASSNSNPQQQKRGQKASLSAQQTSKSPATPSSSINDSRLTTIGGPDSPSALGKTVKKPISRSSSHKPSPIPSTSSDRGIKPHSRNVSSKREPLAGRQTSRTRASSKASHCHECGAKFPSASARFCPDCGVKKMTI
ncbi:hypothetical protein Aperf_G00000071666 [Anoplocephala perfoliata]